MITLNIFEVYCKDLVLLLLIFLLIRSIKIEIHIKQVCLKIFFTWKWPHLFYIIRLTSGRLMAMSWFAFTYIRLMGTKLLHKFLFAVLPVQNLCGVVPVQVLVVQEKVLGQHIVRHQREGKPMMNPCLAHLTKGS